MKKYHIRFNQQHNNTGYDWRIFEDGKEHLVKHFKVNVPIFDEMTTEEGITKWNVCCYGVMTLIDDVATIN